MMDCLWYRYNPQLPLWGVSWNQYNWSYDYYPWTCNYLDDMSNETLAELEEGGELPEWAEPSNVHDLEPGMHEPTNVTEVDNF